MVLEDMQDLLLASDSPHQLFKPVRTLPIVGLLLFSNITALTIAFVLPLYYFPVENVHPSLYSVLLYIQVVLWTLTVVADQLMYRRHQKSQLRGYLEFNRKILPLLRSFLITVTSCSILLLMTSAISWDFCPRSGSCSVAAPLTPFHYVQVILSLQTFILLPVSVAYAVRVHQFNLGHSLPDIFEGQMVYSLSRSLPTFEDVGIRETSTDDTLLEKQAEAIHFLKEHNARLSRKILSLTDQLGRYSSEGQVTV